MNRRNLIQTASIAAILPQLVSPISAKQTSEGSQTMTITPFKIKIPQKQIDDLKSRLEMTRWPSVITDDWSRGQPVSFIKELTKQWLHKYDWRKHEAQLNSYPQFITEIDGQPIHFLHIKSTEPKAFPLILTHGWPSTVAEYLGIIGPLSDPRANGLEPAIAFDLVIPSLPGFGFSSPMTAPGWDTAHVAKAWDTLMKRLGYTRYGAQGGDVGALVGKELGILKPAGLVGTHLQQIFAFPKGTPGEMDKLSPFDLEAISPYSKSDPQPLLLGLSIPRSHRWLGIRSCSLAFWVRLLKRLIATSFSPMHQSTGSLGLADRRQIYTMKMRNPAPATAKSATIPRRVSRCSRMISAQFAVSPSPPITSCIGPKCPRAVILRRTTRLICWWLMSGNSLRK
jgi:pimeloyl-ACP methyl ester carboxylesterase